MKTAAMIFGIIGGLFNSIMSGMVLYRFATTETDRLIWGKVILIATAVLFIPIASFVGGVVSRRSPAFGGWLMTASAVVVVVLCVAIGKGGAAILWSAPIIIGALLAFLVARRSA